MRGQRSRAPPDFPILYTLLSYMPGSSYTTYLSYLYALLTLLTLLILYVLLLSGSV